MLIRIISTILLSITVGCSDQQINESINPTFQDTLNYKKWIVDTISKNQPNENCKIETIVHDDSLHFTISKSCSTNINKYSDFEDVDLQLAKMILDDANMLDTTRMKLYVLFEHFYIPFRNDNYTTWYFIRDFILITDSTKITINYSKGNIIDKKTESL